MFFFVDQLFRKILSEIQSESQTVLIPIRPDLGPNCLQMLSADDTSRERVEFSIYLCDRSMSFMRGSRKNFQRGSNFDNVFIS